MSDDAGRGVLPWMKAGEQEPKDIVQQIIYDLMAHESLKKALLGIPLEKLEDMALRWEKEIVKIKGSGK